MVSDLPYMSKIVKSLSVKPSLHQDIKTSVNMLGAGYSFALLLVFTLHIARINAVSHEKDIQVTVPENAFQHGDPHTVCVPTKWYNFVVFYLVNYFAHAATVKTAPGEPFSLIILNMVSALFFPYYGITRGIEAIYHHAICYRGLDRAAHAGALCTIIRTNTWRPPANQTVKGISISETDDRYGFDVSLPLDLQEIDQGSRFCSRRVHGLYALPPEGYGIAILPPNTKILPNLPNIGTKDEREMTSDFKVSATYSLVKGITAAAQISFAIATLVRTTSGVQIEMFGYAAFGWTALPYLIMSAVNIAGSIATPDYPTLYLVGSFELDEAARIAESIDGPDVTGFDGTVGRLIQDEDTSGTFELSISGELKCRLTSRTADSPQSTDSPQRVITINEESNERLKIPACACFNKESARNWSKSSVHLFSVSISILFGVIPYAVIGSLTGFQNGRSTLAERVLTQFWLATGIIIGAVLCPLLDHSLRSVLFQAERRTNRPKLLITVLFVAFYAAPAVGGYAIVGLMLKKFGSCQTY